MTKEEVYKAMENERTESGYVLVEDNFVFEPVVVETELEKYYRYLIMADEGTYYMESKRHAPRASYYYGGVWTLADSCGNFVAVAHVETVWNGEHHVWKGEVKYLDK